MVEENLPLVPSAKNYLQVYATDDALWIRVDGKDYDITQHVKGLERREGSVFIPSGTDFYTMLEKVRSED